MPRNKDLKRLVRARMTKTGEAYTAARAQVLRKSPAKTTSRSAPRTDSAPAVTASPAADQYADLAGMSDTSIKEKTGRTWNAWVRTLDGHGAEKMAHGKIAAIVNGEYGVDGWWSQTVTVGYERIKGLRARGQRRDGSYEASKSRTFSVPVETLFDAWANPSIRRRWLTGVTVKVRTATPHKSMRLGWSDSSIVAVGFTPKGASKSAVALAHTKLPDREAAARFKQFWSERLDALGELLSKL